MLHRSCSQTSEPHRELGSGGLHTGGTPSTQRPGGRTDAQSTRPIRSGQSPAMEAATRRGPGTTDRLHVRRPRQPCRGLEASSKRRPSNWRRRLDDPSRKLRTARGREAPPPPGAARGFAPPPAAARRKGRGGGLLRVARSAAARVALERRGGQVVRVSLSFLSFLWIKTKFLVNITFS